MYSFAQRRDTHVMDEPFYAVYLVRKKADHPGKEEVLESLPQDEHVVMKKIFSDWSKPVLFIKNMAHHIEVIDSNFIMDVTNIFLIRDPAKIIASYIEVIDKPVMSDIGVQHQFQLFSRLRKKGITPIVVDSGLLLENPEHVLKKLCEQVEVPFLPEMLQWQKGPKSYDGVWAKYWYRNVHSSDGFQKPLSQEKPIPDNLMSLYEEARYYYQQLLPFALVP